VKNTYSRRQNKESLTEGVRTTGGKSKCYFRESARVLEFLIQSELFFSSIALDATLFIMFEHLKVNRKIWT
jgi:hypothetical protein